MSLLFQSPALLGLLALAGLPVLVHLLSRARPPAYRFSNLDFMRRVLRKTSRVRKPKDGLLLLLRTLALLALAASFAAPFLVSRSGALPGEKKSVVLLIDRSASMAARDGVGTRFDAACAEAASYLEKAKPGAANIVWIDAEPDAVYPEPGANTAYLTDLLQQARPVPEAGSLSAAFDLALRQLADAPGRRELIVLSDFQSSAWRDFQPSLPANIHVQTHRFATQDAPNTAVSRILVQPAQAVVGQDLTVLVQVLHFSPDRVRTRLTLDADGSRQTQDIELSPWGASEAAFVLRPAKPGALPISATLESDAFPGDDARHAVATVRDSLRMSVDGPQESAEFRLLTKLASALPWLEAAPRSPDSKPADFRFVSGWSGADAAALRQSAIDGMTVLVQPVPGCPLPAIQQLVGQDADAAGGALAPDSSPAGWQVVPVETHRAHRMFATGDFGNPYAGTFRERLKAPRSLSEVGGARPVALYSDGVPALLEYPTKGGSIVLWNLPLDPAKSDWPVQGVFLPAVAELLLGLRPQASAESSYLLPGVPLVWSSSDPAHVGAVRLADAAGRDIEVAERATENGAAWTSVETAVPGLYRWEISGQPVDFTAVNFPDSESDLRILDQAPDFGRAAASSGSLVRRAELAQGIPLWPWLAAAALLFLLLESFTVAAVFNRQANPQ